MSDIDSSITTKVCSTCKNEKTTDNFSKKKRFQDGLNTQCKQCQSLSWKRYYKIHQEKLKVKAAEYHKTHPPTELRRQRNRAYWAREREALSRRRKAAYAINQDSQINNRKRSNNWYYKNQQRQSEYLKKYYSDNAERIKERVRNYEKLNIEKVRAWSRVKSGKRRARLNSSDNQYSVEDIQRLLALQNNKCANCRKPLTDGYHIDHRQPVAKGGDNHRHNIELLCPVCNGRKAAKLPHVFAQENGRLL